MVGGWAAVIPGINLARFCLPRRTVILVDSFYLYECRKLGVKPDPDTAFDGYRCVDCYQYELDAQTMVTHQKRWHGWGKLWKRLLDN